MIEFQVKQWTEDGEFVSNAVMGAASLAIEIEHLPIGWRMEVKRIARKQNGNVVPMKKEG